MASGAASSSSQEAQQHSSPPGAATVNRACMNSPAADRRQDRHQEPWRRPPPAAPAVQHLPQRSGACRRKRGTLSHVSCIAENDCCSAEENCGRRLDSCGNASGICPCLSNAEEHRRNTGGSSNCCARRNTSKLHQLRSDSDGVSAGARGNDRGDGKAENSSAAAVARFVQVLGYFARDLDEEISDDERKIEYNGLKEVAEEQEDLWVSAVIVHFKRWAPPTKVAVKWLNEQLDKTLRAWRLTAVEKGYYAMTLNKPVATLVTAQDAFFDTRCSCSIHPWIPFFYRGADRWQNGGGE